MKRLLAITSLLLILTCGIFAWLLLPRSSAKLTISQVPIYPGAHSIRLDDDQNGHYEHPLGRGSTSWHSVSFVTADQPDLVVSFYTNWLARNDWIRVGPHAAQHNNVAPRMFEKVQRRWSISGTNLNGPLFGAPWLTVQTDSLYYRFTIQAANSNGATSAMFTLEP